MPFQKTLADLMQLNGVSNYKLAKAIGCSQSSPANWLKGTVPDVEKLQKIADYFGVTTDYLLTGEEKEKPLVSGDEELTEYLEMLKNRPECRMLFKLSKGATKEDVEQAVKIIEALRK